MIASIDRSHHRKKFTKEEDDRLVRLVKKLGTKSWEEIAKYMPKRCGRQCRDRYNNYLLENFTKGPWGQEEDELINAKYEEIGPHWVEISKLLPGRSGNDVKNRWHKKLSKSFTGSKPQNKQQQQQQQQNLTQATNILQTSVSSPLNSAVAQPMNDTDDQQIHNISSLLSIFQRPQAAAVVHHQIQQQQLQQFQQQQQLQYQQQQFQQLTPLPLNLSVIQQDNEKVAEKKEINKTNEKAVLFNSSSSSDSEFSSDSEKIREETDSIFSFFDVNEVWNLFPINTRETPFFEYVAF